MIWVIFAICCVFYVIYLNWNTKNLPPAPFIIPIVGNLYNFGFAPLESLAKLHKKHGPIVRLQLGTICTIVISDGELIREAFLHKGKIYSDRPHLPTHDLLLGHDVVGSDYGPYVKASRKMFFTLFRHSPESKLQSVFQTIHAQLFDILGSYAESGEPVEIQDYLKRTTTAGTLKIMFNMDMKLQRKENEDPEIGKLLHLIDSSMDLLGAFDLSSYYPKLAVLYTKHHNYVAEFAKHRDEFLEAIVRSHIQNLDESNPKDWIDQTLINTKDMPDREKYFNSSTIAFLAWDMLLGGADTTATTLNWLCILLASFPEIQKKLQNEVKTVLQGNLPGKADMSKLPYTSAVIKESMRIRPILPFYFPHRINEDDTLSGYHIPKNSQILGNSYAYHLSEKYFPNPLQFNPDRYLDPANPTQDVLPFGFGYRQCVGQGLGEFQVFYSTVTLMQHFSFKLVPGHEINFMQYDFKHFLRAKPYKILIEKNF